MNLLIVGAGKVEALNNTEIFKGRKIFRSHLDAAIQ